MPLMIKVCGVTDPAAVAAAVTAGVDALGFVFAASPRQVTPRTAAELCQEVPENVIRVAVMRHPATDAWNAVRDEFGPDWLQTDAEDFSTLDIPSNCLPMPVYRDRTMAQNPPTTLPTRLLFEAARSGVGERADWSLAATVASRTRLVLAGGLDPDNVAAAIRQVRPWGVDVSSGVETQPGNKDAAKIKQFIARARAVDS